MNDCPCCSTPLLRHARYQQMYWFCPRCRQEMPSLSRLLKPNAQRSSQVALKSSLF